MTPANGVRIEARGLRKAYDGIDVLRGVDLSIEPGETLVIIGGSGEGKSVLLRQLAGLEYPDAGSVHMNELELHAYLALPPHEKPFRMSMVFQGSALLNSLSVAENLALRLREHEKMPEDELQQLIADCLRQVDMAGTEDKLPGDLSGGMRKRVAIARALAAQPQVIFHDEPTADLDPVLTEQIGGLISHIQSKYGATQVLVTHDLSLAVEVGNRIAVLHAGKLVDVLAPDALQNGTHPYTRTFVQAACVKMQA